MGSKQQIEKDRERIAELYKIIREKIHNYDLAIEALALANKYLNKADNQRMELALKEEIIRCKDCEFHKKDGCLGSCDIHELTIVGEDCISRQAAIDAIEPTLKSILQGNSFKAVNVMDKIRDLPSAQPFTEEQIQTMQELESAQLEKAYELGKADRPKGHWIENAQEYYEMINEKGGGVDENTPYFTDDIACSECLAKFSVIDNETERFDFCPNCGSYNGGGEE